MSVQNNISGQKNNSVTKSISLYLKVHIMPKLNTPLGGKAWHWIVPFVSAGALIVALVYFFGN